MSRVLLFVQNVWPLGRPKCVHRFPPVFRYIKGGWEEWAVEYSKTKGVDRWWLVECENAEAGRHIIAARQSGTKLHEHDGRILISGGRP